MKLIKTTAKRSKIFSVLHASRECQAAMMTLRPGQSSSDEPENEYPRCEQWLLVISGTGKAIVGKRRTNLRSGDLLLIEKGEPHKISQSGRESLVTVNFYAPPAYDSEGEVKP